jgi:hypothetical protein
MKKTNENEKKYKQSRKWTIKQSPPARPKKYKQSRKWTITQSPPARPNTSTLVSTLTATCSVPM